MTFKKFEELFRTKYPEGTVWAHDIFEHDVPGRVQKVAVVFTTNGKVYKYRGAYEDILCKVGVPVISKERFATLESSLNTLKANDGKTDEFFGLTFDYSADIARITAEIENYRANYTIV